MTPVFLDPLWNADYTLAVDALGNILYTEPVLKPDGTEYLTADGSLLLKVPMRDEAGDLIYDAITGLPLFYEPFVIPTTGEMILDSSTGLPLFPSAYYDVPQNTLPLSPAEEEFDFPDADMNETTEEETELQ